MVPLKWALRVEAKEQNQKQHKPHTVKRAKFRRDNWPIAQVKIKEFVLSVESLAFGSMEEEMGKNSSLNTLFLEGGVALGHTISPVKEKHALSKKEQRTLPIWWNNCFLYFFQRQPLPTAQLFTIRKPIYQMFGQSINYIKLPTASVFWNTSNLLYFKFNFLFPWNFHITYIFIVALWLCIMFLALLKTNN